jgi:hypothetical protein
VTTDTRIDHVPAIRPDDGVKPAAGYPDNTTCARRDYHRERQIDETSLLCAIKKLTVRQGVP